MKRILAVLTLLALALALTGCGRLEEKPAGTEAPAQTEKPAVTEAPEQTEEPAQAEQAETPAGKEPAAGGTLQERVEAAAKDAADLAPFFAEDLADMAGIQPEDYTDFVFLQGDVTEGREILALRAADEAAADRLAGQMQKYLERRREENRNYSPKAFQALSEARVERKGLLLVMISGGDAAAETAALLAGE